MKAPFDRIEEYALRGGGRLLVAPTSTKDVVCVEGSFFGGKRMVSAERDVLPALAASLLDAGTTKQTKEQLRERLAARGISLEFAAGVDRTEFSARCFPEDLSVVLGTIAECINSARFPEVELKVAKARELGALAEEKTNTRAQANRALAAKLYVPTHPNFVRTIGAEEASLRALARRDLVSFQQILGRGGLVLVVAGDVVPAKVRALAEKSFGALRIGTRAPEPFAPNTKKASASETRIHLADKANVDVRMGASLPVTYTSPEYYAMCVLIEMLGGKSFTSHLMQTIRERDGLTYGVYAGLAGLEGGVDGYLKIWASFSPERYTESIEALRKEVGVFFASGMTDDVRLKNIERMRGSYEVGLSTTRGLASTLHALAAENRPLDYLETYPDMLSGVSQDALHAAAALIPLDALTVAAAGTFR